MEQLDRTPKYPSAASAPLSPQACPDLRVSSVASAGFASVASNASCMPIGKELARRSQTGPRLAPVPGSLNSNAVIDDLRSKISAIERHPVKIGEALDTEASASASWTLGVPELDAALGGGRAQSGLDCAGVHEIKSSAAGSTSAAAGWASSVGFALRLAIRRHSQFPIVWCWPKSFANEIGNLYGPGLAELGIDPSRLLMIETARERDALWAMEEALKSGAAGLVIGVLHELDLLEARRLSLACQSALTPCLLVSHAARPSAASTASRWRTAVQPSSPHPLVASHPGAFVVHASIERCRLNPALPQSDPFALEWCDETHRFRMPAPLVYRTAGRGENTPPFKIHAYSGSWG